MATYTKETALYDTGAIATDIANAGTTATSYITRVDATSGIRVHDLNESTDFVQVNSSAISMYRGGTAAANEKVRIEDDEIRVGATTTGHAILDEDGMDVFIGDTSVAHYGDYARIGNAADGEAYTMISPNEVTISAGNNINALKITPDGNDQVVNKTIDINRTIDVNGNFSYTHPSEPATGTTLKYEVYSLYNDYSYVISITKGTSVSTTTISRNDQFKFRYSATTTTLTIENIGTKKIFVSYVGYKIGTVSPLTEIGGVLTLGQYPDVGSNTVLAVGNGTESADNNLFEISRSAYPVSIGGSHMEDFVVEWNVNGIWTYRKWSSGIAECWGTYSATISHLGGVLNGYSYSVVVSFPSNLFIEVPNVTYSAFLSNAYALTGTLNTSLTKDSATLYAVSNTSGSKSSTWYIKVIGKWK